MAAIYHNANPAQVYIPATPRQVMCMADSISVTRPLAANITHSGHCFSQAPCLNAEPTFYQYQQRIKTTRWA